MLLSQMLRAVATVVVVVSPGVIVSTTSQSFNLVLWRNSALVAIRNRLLPPSRNRRHRPSFPLPRSLPIQNVTLGGCPNPSFRAVRRLAQDVNSVLPAANPSQKRACGFLYDSSSALRMQPSRSHSLLPPACAPLLCPASPTVLLPLHAASRTFPAYSPLVASIEAAPINVHLLPAASVVRNWALMVVAGSALAMLATMLLLRLSRILQEKFINQCATWEVGMLRLNVYQELGELADALGVHPEPTLEPNSTPGPFPATTSAGNAVASSSGTSLAATVLEHAAPSRTVSDRDSIRTTPKLHSDFIPVIFVDSDLATTAPDSSLADTPRSPLATTPPRLAASPATPVKRAPDSSDNAPEAATTHRHLPANPTTLPPGFSGSTGPPRRRRFSLLSVVKISPMELLPTANHFDGSPLACPSFPRTPASSTQPTSAPQTPASPCPVRPPAAQLIPANHAQLASSDVQVLIAAISTAQSPATDLVPAGPTEATPSDVEAITTAISALSIEASKQDGVEALTISLSSMSLSGGAPSAAPGGFPTASTSRMSIEEFGPPPVARTDADLLGPRAKKDRRLWGIGAPGEVSLLAGWEGIQLPPLKRSEYPGAEDSEVVSVAAAEDAEVMEAATAAGTECCQADEATGAAEETDKEQVEATTGQQDVADVFTLAPMNEEMRSIARYATRLSHDTMSAGLRRPRERIQLGLLKPTGATRNALKKVGPLPKKVAPPVVKLQQVLDATSHAQATTKKTAAAGVGPVLKGKENGRLTSTAPNTLPPSAVPSMGPPSAIPGRTRAPSADPTVTARPSNIRPPSRATRPPTFVLRPPGTAAPPARLAHAAPRAPSPAVPPAAAPPPASLIAPRGRYTTAEKGKGRAP